MNISNDIRRALIPLLISAAILIVSLLRSLPPWLSILLTILSFVCTLLSMLTEITVDIKERRFTDRSIIIVFAALVTLCTGHFASAAAALLLYRAGAVAVSRRELYTQGIIRNRLTMTGLEADAAGYEPVPDVADGLHGFLERYLMYIIWGLALLVAVLTPVLFKQSIADGISRGCVIIALSSAAALFSAYPLGDYASTAAAAEHDVIFADGALHKLLSIEAVCDNDTSRQRFGSVEAISVDEGFLSPDSLLLLAAHAYCDIGGETARILAQAYPSRLDPAAVSEARELKGLGVIAKIRDMTVLAGSAQLMKLSGLPLKGFDDANKAIHVGINGRYAGRILLKTDTVSSTDLLSELNTLNLTKLSAPYGGGDSDGVLLAFSGGFRPDNSSPADVFAACGGYAEKADVYLSASGSEAIHSILRLVYNALTIRTASFMIMTAVKLIALLLAIFGLLPLWIAVAAEAAALLLSLFFTLRALDFTLD